MVTLEFKNDKDATLTEKCEEQLFGGKWNIYEDFGKRTSTAFLPENFAVLLDGVRVHGEVNVTQFLDGDTISTLITRTKNSMVEKVGRKNKSSKRITCGQIHQCSKCMKALPPCDLFPFECPWINGDENTQCPECEKLIIEELENEYFKN